MNELPPAIPATAKLAARNFFRQHRDRKIRIRLPFVDEYIAEFRRFGMHEEGRRRIIVAKLPQVLAAMHGVDYMRIPFLLFADEAVEDRDDVLRPILDEIMRDAAEGYGMRRR